MTNKEKLMNLVSDEKQTTVTNAKIRIFSKENDFEDIRKDIKKVSEDIVRAKSMFDNTSKKLEENMTKYAEFYSSLIMKAFPWVETIEVNLIVSTIIRFDVIGGNEEDWNDSNNYTLLWDIENILQKLYSNTKYEIDIRYCKERNRDIRFEFTKNTKELLKINRNG